MKEKNKYDTWFDAQCEEEWNKIPQLIRELAMKNVAYAKPVADSIARKKGFRPNAVIAFLLEKKENESKQK